MLLNSPARLSAVALSFCLVATACDRSKPAEITQEPTKLKPRQPLRSEEAEAGPVAEADDASTADAPRWARPAPTPIDPAKSLPNPANIERARQRYEALVPRVSLQSWQRFDNLIYEANNLLMRGPRDEQTGLYRHTGQEIAATWRRYARGVRGLFVLRDSLFSQQDHPHAHDPYAPLLPPNWVTAVAHAAATDRDFVLPTLPAVGEHAAWHAFETPEQLFGDLPSSESMFEAATAPAAADEPQPGVQARAKNARETLHILYRDVRAMMAAIPRGPDEVAKLGAERISASDRAYFGDELRRERIIPIFVENPNAHEVDEGKGLVVPGEPVSADILELTRRAIYGRRLQDGDLAIERYDLSKPEERTRAIDVLEALIPAPQPETNGEERPQETKVWLWVTGELDPHKKLQGEDARAYVPTFQGELAAADVDTSRLVLFSKPSVEFSGADFQAELDRELAGFERLDMPMSIKLPTTAEPLREVICCQE